MFLPFFAQDFYGCKNFVLNGVVNSFSSFPCFRVSGVIDNLWKATLMSLSIDCCIFKLANDVIFKCFKLNWEFC